MKNKRKFSKKLIKKFEKRMVAQQDAERGVSASRITEIESSKRRISRAFLKSNPELRKAYKQSIKIDEKSVGELETIKRGNISFGAQAEDIRRTLEDALGMCACTCCVRDFKLLFTRGVASPEFNTEIAVTEVEQGLVGWGNFSYPKPKMTNTGNRNGQLINGNLDLYWKVSVPHDGIFAMRPNQNRTSFPVFGSHRVRGRGWAFSGIDSRVEVHAWVIVYLDSQWLYGNHVLVSSDKTKSENRTKNFSKWIDLPGRMTFQAQAGQQLGMIVRLSGLTWANDDGLAEIKVDSFGIPSNTLDDMHIDVLD